MPPKRSVAKFAKTEPSSTPTFTPLRATLSKRAGAVHPDDTDVWVTGDGGIYRSTSGGANHTWQTRNNGLGVLEPGYLAATDVFGKVLGVRAKVA